MESKKKVIAFVGAGGKTSAIYACAAKYAAAGKKVLIMTTTKMGLPEKQELLVTRPDPVCVRRVLHQYGICVSGKRCPDPSVEKIDAWNEDVMRQLAGEADLVLLEADGAKKKSLKVPAAYEPVIPDWCTQLVILMGLSKLGSTCREEVHRYQLLFSDQECITPDTYVRILAEGYAPKIRTADREALWKQQGQIWFLLNQADDQKTYRAGLEIFSKLNKRLEFTYKTGILSLHRHKVWMLEE